MATRQIQKYGWIPDIPDHRDLQFSSHFQPLAALPASVDLRPKMPAIYDQGALGSCTANSIGAAFEYDLIKQNLSVFTPSRLFIYYNERKLEGTIKVDSGAMLRDGIKTVAKEGACKETTWPYDIAKFARRPTIRSYQEGVKHVGVKYYSVTQTETDIKTALASGYPVIFGFAVYSYFESPEMAKNAVLDLPKPGESMLGGHAVLIVGYDDATRRFTVRNSWSANWGDNGHFYMAYDYVTNSNLSDDFWVLEQISG